MLASSRSRARQRQRQRQQLNAPDVSTPPTLTRLDVIATSGGKATVETVVPICDRSADVGTRHYWRDGAQPGEFCLCGKRKKYDLTKPL